MSFEIDNTTVALLVILASLLLYSRFFSSVSPLVHPLLLGKQSEVSAVRRKGETGIYRSFATGQGSPFAVRPAGGLKTVKDITPSSGSSIPRHILDITITDESLKEITQLLPKGLKALFPDLDGSRSIITLIPPSQPTTLPLLLLQLSCPAPLVVLPSPILLSSALSSSDHPSPAVVVVTKDLADDVVEQVWEANQGKTGVLIIGDPEKSKAGIAKSAANQGVTVQFWEDIWESAETSSDATLPADPIYSDVHSYFYSIDKAQNVSVSKITHINITAGVAGLLSIFPADKRPSATHKDVIASSARLDTPFGMTLALAAIYSGSGFRFIGPSTPTWPTDESHRDEHVSSDELLRLMDEKIGPKQTILFGSANHHRIVVEELYKVYQSSPLADLATRHKLTGISGGDVSRKGWWESSVWKPIRRKPLNGLAESLRAFVVLDGTPQISSLPFSHLLLSIPISRIQSSVYSTGPIFSSHYYDLQTPIPRPFKLSWQGEKSHSGPPAVNVEVKLKGSGVDEKLEKGEIASGRVYARGPGLLDVIKGGKEVQRDSDDGWVDLGIDASVQTNGTFIIADH